MPQVLGIYSVFSDKAKTHITDVWRRVVLNSVAWLFLQGAFLFWTHAGFVLDLPVPLLHLSKHLSRPFSYVCILLCPSHSTTKHWLKTGGAYPPENMQCSQPQPRLCHVEHATLPTISSGAALIGNYNNLVNECKRIDASLETHALQLQKWLLPGLGQHWHMLTGSMQTL